MSGTSGGSGGRGPEWSMATVLRGFPGFEDYYQGLSRKTPIALSPYPKSSGGRDPLAAKNYDALSGLLAKQAAGAGPAADAPGVDGATSPNLLQAVQVAMGADVCFCLPRPAFGYPISLTYEIVWRIRTPATLDKIQQPFHNALGDARYIDTCMTSDAGWDPATSVFTGASANRAILGSIAETIRFTQTPPETDPFQNLGQQNDLDVGIQPRPGFGWPGTLPAGAEGVPADFQIGPILPMVGGNGNLNTTTGKRYVYGEFGQNPLSTVGATVPYEQANLATFFRTNVSHATYTTKAKGDEAILLVYPTATNDPDFLIPIDYNQAPDFLVSALFGRGGYTAANSSPTPLFPKGLPFGALLLQGHPGGG